MSAEVWPGPLRGLSTLAARKLAVLKQCASFPERSLHCSATPPGQGDFRNNEVLMMEGQLAFFKQSPLFDQNVCL